MGCVMTALNIEQIEYVSLMAYLWTISTFIFIIEIGFLNIKNKEL